MKLSELKLLAEGATPGPWLPMHCDYAIGSFEDDKFIAAANPQTILDLIAKVQGLSEALERMLQSKALREAPFYHYSNAVSDCIESLAQFGPDAELK